jgi:predicted DNA-binding transcriptional regulator YafY
MGMNKINKIILREFNSILNQEPHISTEEMAKKLDISVRTTQRYCNELGIKLATKRESNAVRYLKSKGYTFS